MRGYIDVNSELNVGTTFSVIISSKVKLCEEPRFVRKYQIQKYDKHHLQCEDSKQKKLDGFFKLSSQNLD